MHTAPEHLAERFFKRGGGLAELHTEEVGSSKPGGIFLSGLAVGVPADGDGFFGCLERGGGTGVE